MTNHSTLPTVFVYLLTTIEGLYEATVPLDVQKRKNIQLASTLLPDFIEYSRFTRRCAELLPCLQLMRQALVFQEIQGIDVSIIDSFPIPLCQPVRNFRSKVLGDYADIGYNATKDQYYYGCKCQDLVSESGYVIDYVITPASIADSTMAEGVLAKFATPTVLGNMGYLGQTLNERLKLKGIELITSVRKNMKQKVIDFPDFPKRRKVIERVFSFLTNLGAERCRSRSIHGFQVMLEMVLLAYSLSLKCAKTLEPQTLRYFYRTSMWILKF